MPTRSFDIDDFDSIRLAAAQDVQVKTGGAPSVKAKGAAEALDRLAVTTADGTLSIAQRGRRRDGVSVKVTVPSLRTASIAGSGGLRIDRVAGASFQGLDRRLGRPQHRRARRRKRANSPSPAPAMSAPRASAAGPARASPARATPISPSWKAAPPMSRSPAPAMCWRMRAETADVSILGSGNVQIVGGAECEVSRLGSGRVQLRLSR